MEEIIYFFRNLWANPFYIGLYLQWIVFLLGFIICIWGFRKTKLKAYVLIALFFMTPFFQFVFQKVSYQLHKEEIETYIEMKNQEIEDKVARGEPIVIDNTLNMPIFETLLVLGLFSLTRTKIKANQLVHDNPDSAPLRRDVQA